MTVLPNPFDDFASAERAAVASLPPASTGDAAAESRFVLDEEAFLNDLDPLPAFLVNPSPEYLSAREILPVLRALAGHP